MRTPLFTLLAAAAALTPAVAEAQRPDRDARRAERQAERAERGDDAVRAERQARRAERRAARGAEFGLPPRGSRADRLEDRRDRREDRLDRREDRIDARRDTGRADRIEDRFDRREDRLDRREDRLERRQDRFAQRGYVQNRGWNRGWRGDRRYDYRTYRQRYAPVYRVGRYYAPGGYGYRRFGIGFTLGRPFYASRYFINDPYRYRLPPAHGSYRWVRYYDDVLLVDTWNGRVVDVIHDFFW